LYKAIAAHAIQRYLRKKTYRREFSTGCEATKIEATFKWSWILNLDEAKKIEKAKVTSFLERNLEGVKNGYRNRF